MILNTGNRTDIPAFYSEWFYNRIREGYVMTRNPYYPEQVLRYRLDPEVVDILCFCSKNPGPMLGRLDELDRFRQFWFVTITPYGRDVEPYVPDWEAVAESFCRLSERLGREAVSWRYDPVFISERYPVSFHLDSFEKMAERMKGAADHCVISFIDLYEKTKRNFPDVREVRKAEREQIGQEFVRIGKKYGIGIRSCCEGTDLVPYGVDVSGCMTKDVLERAIGCVLEVSGKGNAKREGCDCLLGSDIGMYNTCGHGCLYCYANYDRKTVEQNIKRHDPKSPFLIGGFRQGDIVREARQISCCSGQRKFV